MQNEKMTFKGWWVTQNASRFFSFVEGRGLSDFFISKIVWNSLSPLMMKASTYCNRPCWARTMRAILRGIWTQTQAHAMNFLHLQTSMSHKVGSHLTRVNRWNTNVAFSASRIHHFFFHADLCNYNCTAWLWKHACHRVWSQQLRKTRNIHEYQIQQADRPTSSATLLFL